MFEPWIGNRYSDDENLLGGRRLMILGESHYSTDPDEIHQTPEGYTPNVIEWMAIKKRHQFFGKVQEIVTQQPRRLHTTADKSAFWHAVSFYNYVPTIADGRSHAEGGARRRPSHEMFEAGYGPFELMRKRLEAEVILVTGKELWFYVCRHLNLMPFDAREFAIIDDGEAIITWIRHPSWPGFKPAAYYRQMSLALELAGQPRQIGRNFRTADIEDMSRQVSDA